MLGNTAASGTAILDEFGEEHQRTGKWIVYTSADSVFQVAAHEATVPLAELYARLRGRARAAAGRARRLAGDRPALHRHARGLGPDRAAQGLQPSTRRAPTLLDRLADAHIPRVGVGKVDDLFAGRGISSIHTATNADAYALIDGRLARDATRPAARQRDRVRPDLGSPQRRSRVRAGPRGARPRRAPTARRRSARTTWLSLPPITGTTRPRRPPITRARWSRCWSTGPRVRPVALGRRRTFADIGQTVAEFLGVAPLATGTSFLSEVWID